MGRRGYGGGGKGDYYIPIATLTTRMTSALRWAAVRAILMFHNCEGQSHKTVSTDHTLPLGQTGSPPESRFCVTRSNRTHKNTVVMVMHIYTKYNTIISAVMCNIRCRCQVCDVGGHGISKFKCDRHLRIHTSVCARKQRKNNSNVHKDNYTGSQLGPCKH